MLGQVDHREGLLTLAQLEESWMQCQLSLSGLIQEHMNRLSRPGHFLQVTVTEEAPQNQKHVPSTLRSIYGVYRSVCTVGGPI